MMYPSYHNSILSNKISRLLAKHNIKTTHIPARKNVHMVTSAKDGLGLKAPGIYHNPVNTIKYMLNRLATAVKPDAKSI